ncbi:MAG: hypothetical protein V7724_07445 [Sediminicola sp.]
MKMFICTLAGTALILFSCSTDGEHYPHSIDNPYSLQKVPSTAPWNNENAYDPIGRSYWEALSSSKHGGMVTGLGQKINGIASTSSERPNKKKLSPSHPSNKYAIATIDSIQDLQSIITGSDLTLEVQDSLFDFAMDVLDIQYDGYGTLYDFIIGYEAMVAAHTTFTERDKQVILTFSSLVRHAPYPGNTTMSEDEDEEDDEDWDLSVGNIMQYIQIALDGTADGTEAGIHRQLKKRFPN